MSRDASNFPPPPTNTLLPEQPHSRPPYQSGHVLSRWVTGLLVANMLVSVFVMLMVILEISLLSEVKQGTLFNPATYYSHHERLQNLGIVQAVVYLSTAILFFAWFYRAHKNLPVLGAQGLSYTPRGTLGWWFVPFANLVRPYQVMREVWKASNPEGRSANGMGWKSLVVTPKLKLWWGLWLMNFLIGNVLVQIFIRVRNPSIDMMIMLNWVLILLECLKLIAALLLIGLVNQITRWQELIFSKDESSEPHSLVTPSKFALQHAPTSSYRVRRVARSPKQA
jgi:hypothetical protein